MEQTGPLKIGGSGRLNAGKGHFADFLITAVRGY